MFLITDNESAFLRTLNQVAVLLLKCGTKNARNSSHVLYAHAYMLIHNLYALMFFDMPINFNGNVVKDLHLFLGTYHKINTKINQIIYIS